MHVAFNKIDVYKWIKSFLQKTIVMQSRSTKVFWLIDTDPMRWPVPELNDYSVQTLVDLLLNVCQHLVSSTFNFNKLEIPNRLLTVIDID